MTDQAMLERFHHALAAIIESERPAGLARPVTVAELYQDLASYPRMRDLIGLEMHADYEHMLVQLLAGAEGRVRLEPDAARDELRLEMESADPNLSIYRRFAACEVHVNPPAVDAVMSSPVTAPASAAAAAGGRSDPPAAPAPSTAAPRSGPSAALQAQAESVPASHETAPGRCVFCAEPLPEYRDVSFCPQCGGDQRMRPCRSCGETLEGGWRFCVSCGTAVAGA